MSESYQKPQQRKRMICHWCRWNADGTIRSALYRPARDDRNEGDAGLFDTLGNV